MRPTRYATDLEYWCQAREYWKQKAEEWFLLTASKGATKEDIAFYEEREDKARDMLFRAELKHQEAQGILVVYTGRAKPRWS